MGGWALREVLAASWEGRTEANPVEYRAKLLDAMKDCTKFGASFAQQTSNKSVTLVKTFE
jgi:hypothetical protein